MASNVVDLEERKERGKTAVKKLRARGVLTGVLYGRQMESKPFKSSDAQFVKLLKSGAKVLRARLNNEEFDVIVKEVQHDWLRDVMLHVDLQRTVAGQKVRVTVPLVGKGEAKGQAAGGIVEYHFRELEVECEPSRVPDRIVVDISGLDLGQSIHISELPLPPGVTVDIHPETPAITVVLPALVTEPTPAAAGEEEPKEPEVITARPPKEGEEGEEEEEEEEEKK